MTKATLNTKLLKCFFALALVLGLCVPSIGSSAYGNPDQDVVFTEVSDAMQEDAEEPGEEGDGADAPTGTDAVVGEGDTDANEPQAQPEGEANEGPTADEPASNDGAADDDQGDQPLYDEDDATEDENDIAPLSDDGIVAQAADSTVGGLTISGGTVNADFTHAANLVVVKTSTPLTLTGTFTGSVQIQAGVHAHLILNGVTITGNSTSSPINLMTSSQAHITLMDGTTNTLDANQQLCAALHCGDGSTLWIDDQLVNFDAVDSSIATANHVEVNGGVVSTDGFVTDVVTGQKTAVKAGDILPKITSANPGTLVAKGGYSASGIGSGPAETAGEMIFDGGDIWAYSWGGHSANHGNSAANDGVTNAEGVSNTHSSGSGIGAGGGNAGATDMTFNAATVHAYGSYHGAGIGAGWSSGGTTLQAGASTSTRNKGNCGNININGGYLLSQGYAHGNAFGGACGTNMNNSKVRITGGTLLPYSHSSRRDIGGSGGDVIISGGSIRLSGTQAAKFQSRDNKAYADEELTQEVVPISVNLGAETGKTDYKITDWSLYIDGKKYDYGAPASFDKGELFLWLPPAVNNQVVSVELTYYNEETGRYVVVEPLYRDPSNAEDANVRRYVAFDLPPELFTEGTSTTVTLPDGLELPRDLWEDGVQPETVAAIVKNYDGLPFSTADISQAGHEIVFDENGEERILNRPDLIDYKFQVVDFETKTLGAEQSSGTQMPSDEGLMAFSMTSTQYATGDWAASYLGHRSRGWIQINPVPSRIVSLKAAWGKTDGNKSDAFDKLIVVGDVTSGKDTAVTCKAPTGEIEIVVDGEVVDTVPVTYPATGVTGNTTVVTSKAEADSLISAAIANNKLNNASLLAMARDLPLQAEAGIAAQADSATVTSSVERDASYDGRQHGIFTYTIDVSKNDYLMPATPNGDKHTVTLNYRPDKNYLDSLGLEDNNLQEEIEVEQVKPDSGVTPGPGSDVKEDPEDPDNPDNPADPNDPSSKEFKKSYTVTGTYGTNNGKIEMTIQSPSYGPFEITNSNGAVIGVVEPELVVDTDGNPVKVGDNLQYKVVFNMDSAGETDIVMVQRASGAYGKSTFTFDVTVYPNPGDAPKIDITVDQENLGNPDTPDAAVAPDGMAQPGDVIRYTVTASNTVSGSAWQTPEITDVLSDDVTIDPDSIEVAINYPTPPDTPEVDEDGNPIPVPEPVWVKPDPSTYEIVDGKVIFKPEASVYGDQSVSIRFNAKVNAGTSDRDKDQDPVEISNEATGTGSYGINENPATKDTNPGTKRDIPDANITVTNPDPLTVIPDDVADGDLSVNKTVKNLSRSNGDRALVGDELEFTIKVTNNTPDSCLYNAFVLDPLPKGVIYVAGSLKLVNARGEASTPSDSAYNASLNALGLYVGDLYYGEVATVTFTAKVGSDAREGGADNVAFSSGDQPTKEKDPDKDKPGDNPSDPSDPSDPDNPDNPDNPTDPDNPNKPHYPNNPVDPSDPGKEPVLPTDPDDINKNTPTDPNYDPTKPSVNVDIDGDGKPDVNIDTDGDGVPDVNIVDKDGDGVPDNIDPEDPTIDPDDPDTWPKPDVNILPKDPSDPTFDPKTDLIPEVNVDTDGDGKPDVNIDTDGDGVPDTKIDEDKNGTPDDEETPTPPIDDPDSFWADKPGMTPDDLDEFIEQLPVTGTNEDDPASPGVVLPSDPNMSNITITKAAENLTHDDGFTYVDDLVRYTITVANSQVDSAWMAVVVRDDVPVGIEPVTDSFKVILADGTEVPVPADSYDPATRILAVNMGDVEGGTAVKFVFDAEIGEEALDSDVGNIAKAYGSLPSGIPGDELNNRAQPGSKFVPSQGWPAYEATHAGIQNPDKVYPSAKVSALSKVRPNPADLEKQLAKTGDFNGVLFASVSMVGLVALAVAALSWRRRRSFF